MYVLEVGFEPTSANTADFKSAPLDQAPAFKHVTAIHIYTYNISLYRIYDSFIKVIGLYKF